MAEASLVCVCIDGEKEKLNNILTLCFMSSDVHFHCEWVWVR